MSFGDLEERPAKKRRFFVEDSPIADPSANLEASKSDGSNALPNLTPQSSSSGIPQEQRLSGPPDGFDVELLNGIAGEELPTAIVDKLKKLSGNNIERGRTYSRSLLDNAN